MDIITLALARKFTKDTVNGLGAIKGAPCTIKSITEDDSSTIVTFGWTGTDGSEQTTELKIPRSNGIQNIEINEEGSLLFTMTNGDTIDVGKLSGNACDPDGCDCVTRLIATDEDVEPLLEQIGLYDVADFALLDE